MNKKKASQLAWSGRPCDACDLRRRSTTLCVYRAPGGRESRGYNLCEDCRTKPKARARTKPLIIAKNALYCNPSAITSSPTKEEKPFALTTICGRMLTLGILNRVPAMSASHLGPRLDMLARDQVLDQVLECVNSKSVAFRSFLRQGGWGPPPEWDIPDISEGINPSDNIHMIKEGVVEQPLIQEEKHKGSGSNRSLGSSTSQQEQKRYLRLVNCKLSRNELEILGYFCETGTVDMLNVSWNRLSGAAAEEIANILRYDACVRLKASWNAFGVRGARAIGAQLPASKTLELVDLSANQLGAEGVALLCDGLKDNISVKSLNVGFNEMRVAGAQAVSRMLKVNRTLEIINIRSNAIGPAGAIAIADALRVNRGIKELIVVDNNIGPEGAEAIAGYFQGSISKLLQGIRGAKS